MSCRSEHSEAARLKPHRRSAGGRMTKTESTAAVCGYRARLPLRLRFRSSEACSQKFASRFHWSRVRLSASDSALVRAAGVAPNQVL